MCSARILPLRYIPALLFCSGCLVTYWIAQTSLEFVIILPQPLTMCGNYLHVLHGWPLVGYLNSLEVPLVVAKSSSNGCLTLCLSLYSQLVLRAEIPCVVSVFIGQGLFFPA